jgi:hypothetical protein
VDIRDILLTLWATWQSYELYALCFTFDAGRSAPHLKYPLKAKLV